MTIAESIALTSAQLPPDKQQKVLDFARALSEKPRQPLRDLYGIWKGVRVSDEDIASMRSEAWGK